MTDIETQYNNVEPERAPELTAEGIMEDRIFAALSYVSVLFVVPWILRADDEDIRFHVRQGIALFGAEMVVWFALFLLDTFLAALLSGGEIWLVKALGAIAWIVFAALSLAGIYFAATGKRWKMPILSQIAARIKV